ncbi:sorbosone dehydrogenase family protein [Thalassospira sp.]|uniref:PQQ-dependent sugar dehydrogenase n=1 Tax=Thalassospira sp. TaxID=1912094 RepID=UPI00261E54D4|nr:sorbosone dehydrogenase family protein [Thalassospira sp.]MCH2277009.1 sorbosone dehydrogenase family protein [Thalassospira sp.]
MTEHLRISSFTTRLLACVALISLSACDDASKVDPSQQIGADPKLPPPESALLPGMKIAEVVGWKDGETPVVPEDLTVSAYARDLANPRTVHTLPNGDVLVVQGRGPESEPVSRPKDFIRGWIMSIAHGGGGKQKESNLITLLRDTDRDGKVDERHDLLTGLNSPFGVAWINDTLYVAATDAVLTYPYQLGQTEIQAAPEILTPLPGGPINHHWTKDLALSPDGQTLYVSVGSNSNIVENGIEAEKGRAAIWAVDAETGASRVYASGLRNPNGLSINPETEALWTVVNERDELGPNLVPDYMTSVEEGGFYGWPWSYYGDHVDERVYPRRPDMVKKAITPDYALSSHVAPLGMTFSQGSALPDDYANGAFVGEHGSWNRDDFTGYKVRYIPFADGKPTGKAKDVVTGFIEGDQAYGRPVGVGIDGTGALLIADDAGNTVWRVAAADGTILSQPIGTDQMPPDSAVAAEAADNGTAPETQGQPSLSTDEQLTGQNPEQSKPKALPSQTEIAPAIKPSGTIEDTDQ